MANVKAIIGLSRGRVAYFEPKANVLIDLSKPVAHIYEGTDTSELKKAIGGAIYLISGSLSDAEPVKVEAPVVEEKVEQATITEVVEEVKVAEPIEEAAPEKPAAKKKSSKK